MKRFVCFFVAVLLFSVMVAVDDVEVNLDGTTSSNAFTVKDNATTPNTLLKVGGDGNVKLQSGKYLNYGATEGATGYGFRDNGGVLEYKNSGGVWTPWVASPYGFASSAYSYGEIAYNHGNYGTTQPTVSIGSSTAYASMFPCTLGGGGGTPYETKASGSVQVINDPGGSSRPAYLKITETGTYRISANVALQGTSNTSIEVEVFRQNSGSVPSLGSWVTFTHDLESLSTALSVTNTQYDAGAVTGIYDLNANDYIALMSRVVSGSSSNQKVICLNLNIQRIK